MYYILMYSTEELQMLACDMEGGGTHIAQLFYGPQCTSFPEPE